MSADVPDQAAGGLPREALIVRGSDPHVPDNLARMMDQARVSFDEGEGYALSVGVGYDPSKSREELIAEIVTACRLPQSRIAVMTVGDVLDAGIFTIVPDGPLPSHANIDLGTALTESVVKDFAELFGPAEDNPAGQQFRKRR